MIYRIGKGNMVKIWEDPWLPRGITRRVSTSRGHIVLTLVSDLIDQESATWDEVLVRGILPAADAEIVLKIPIFEESDDFIAWHYDSKGSFSVKSAYKVHLYSSLRNERAECSGVELDTRCAVCRKYFENGNHLFFSCPEVKNRWRALELEEARLQLCACPSAMEVGRVITQLQKDKAIPIVAFLWCWWNERNKANKGEVFCSVDEFQFKVRHFAQVWSAAFFKEHSTGVHHVSSWQRPPEDFIKINIDGAFHANSGRGGWGWIARDGEGDIIFAASGAIVRASEALQTEAEALIRGILTAKFYNVP
ncbi:hypothetical protein BRADI_1g38111v3 [Brachypodium distachyon]|uniref:RNase H type-1 domain-containing protein n=1 Tax=Brachypodium distachyon TaxID=15368 RepID=A0A2K2DNF3_BRADI|nr:hypothetical protein BRADI_1g38111v3 [Brachypodium distachyon]